MGVVLDRLVDRRLARAAGSHWTRVDGRRFHARHAGPGTAAGPPVVCVHGMGVSSRYMVATMAELPSTVEVYAVDLPGFGLTDKPAEPLDVAGLADALAAWIRAAGLERPTLLANSVGCQIAVDCAVRHPDDVGRMVLVGPTTDPAARTGCIPTSRPTTWRPWSSRPGHCWTPTRTWPCTTCTTPTRTG
jgi:2-hydroxy-6-oxonona-2,4-dienedioate hydrolase